MVQQLCFQDIINDYRAADYMVMAVLGGDTHDWDISAGDTQNIVSALGTTNIIYQNSNQPDNNGHDTTEVIT